MRRRTLIGLGGAALWMAGKPVLAEGAEAAAIREIIDSQIAAFDRQDLDQAFGFASPVIQGLFRTPDNFGRMVRDGYPMIWKPDAVRYLDLRQENGRWVQRVEFRDAGGAYHLFDYEMIAGPDGWRINGVYPVQPSDMAV